MIEGKRAREGRGKWEVREVKEGKFPEVVRKKTRARERERGKI